MQAIDELVEIMECLRDRDTGCPWDREQTSASLTPFTIEEAYEVADAIDRGALDDLRDELGDLLFQVISTHRSLPRAGISTWQRSPATLRPSSCADTRMCLRMPRARMPVRRPPGKRTRPQSGRRGSSKGPRAGWMAWRSPCPP